MEWITLAAPRRLRLKKMSALRCLGTILDICTSAEVEKHRISKKNVSALSANTVRCVLHQATHWQKVL